MTDQKSTPRISIALATYNGAKYLPEQLQSLVQQVHLPFELVACDDGSTDGTVDLLEEFKRISPFPVRVYINDQNLGYADNFLKAAGLCEGEWIAFCDQDDVWLSHKLSAVAYTVTRNSNAFLILQNSYYCTQDLQHSARLFPSSLEPGQYGKHCLPINWVWPGFLQTVRREVFALAPLAKRPVNPHDPDRLLAHDQWTCIVAGVLGSIIVLGDSAALYRRHAKAFTGDNQPVAIAKRVAQSMNNNGPSYAHMARTLVSYAQYMREVLPTCDNVTWRRDLVVAADRAEAIAGVLTLRAELYRAATVSERIRSFMGLLSSGGYTDKQIPEMGPKSAVKDFAAVLGFF